MKIDLLVKQTVARAEIHASLFGRAKDPDTAARTLLQLLPDEAAAPQVNDANVVRSKFGGQARFTMDDVRAAAEKESQ